MSQSSTAIKCFNCGSPLRYDPEKLMLVCDHCGSRYSPEEVDDHLQKSGGQKEAHGSFARKSDELGSWSSHEEQQLASYSCHNCGANLLADIHLVASSCPYCGNNMIIEQNIASGLRPDQIIPFKHIKKNAKDALKQFYTGKPLLPKDFKEENHLDEIKGIYVPFWLYDGVVDAKSTRIGKITRTIESEEYTYIYTDHYMATREGIVEFEKVPADASSKMPDELMDAIEPFHYEDLKEFQTSYLAGFYADKYDVNSEDDSARVDLRIQNTSQSFMEQTFMNYPISHPIEEHFHLHAGNVHYVYLPVWFLITHYKGTTYRFAMNGQTGKMVSDDLPIDKKKALLYFSIALSICMVILYLLLFVFWEVK